MKISSLLFLCSIAFTHTAIAAGNNATPCTLPGYVTSQIDKKVTICEDGAVTHIGHVGATPIKLSVQLTNGSKSLIDVKITTLDGQPAPIGIGTDHTYIASATKDGDKVAITPGVVRDGFAMTLVPTLAKHGKIEVKFDASKSELTSINKYKQGDMEVELPQVTSMNLKQTITLEDGKEVTIPFGPMVNPVKTGETMHSQYTLKLTATKG